MCILITAMCVPIEIGTNNLMYIKKQEAILTQDELVSAPKVCRFTKSVKTAVFLNIYVCCLFQK